MTQGFLKVLRFASFPGVEPLSEKDPMQIHGTAAAAHKHVHGAHHGAKAGKAGKAEAASPKGEAASPKAEAASAAQPAAVVQISPKAQEAYAAAHAKGDADHEGDAK